MSESPSIKRDWLERVICGDNTEVLSGFADECVDLILTSPPYDDLRTYGGHSWNFNTPAPQLIRLLKPGGVIVWVVNDATRDGGETGTSMRQALGFMAMGLRLHDTMIYDKGKCVWPDPTRYGQTWEYMFVLSKGAPKTVNKIKDRVNAWGGTKSFGVQTERMKDGTLKRRTQIEVSEAGHRLNIWKYANGLGYRDSTEHPAPLPMPLAKDHVLSWTNVGDVVLDPFAGSGTSLIAAKELERIYIGVDIEPKYCKIAEARLRQDVLQLHTHAITQHPKSEEPTHAV